MLLWPASALPLLKPYPDDHPLARRLRVRIDGEAPPVREPKLHAHIAPVHTRRPRSVSCSAPTRLPLPCPGAPLCL